MSLLAQVPTHIFDDNGAFKFYPELNVTTKSFAIKKMQSVDNEKLLEEDRKIEKTTDAPFRFGYGFEVNYTLEDGIWEKHDTINIWSMKVLSPGAYSLNFVFERLLLAEGAQLYIYNSKGSMVYGPVTKDQNPSGEFFLSDLVSGDETIIRLIEPVSIKRGSYLKISKVVHAYVNMFPNQSKAPQPILLCHNDINCFPNWANESDGVALVLLANGEEHCSGCLLNNIRNDYRPYFFTAFHCLDQNKDGILSNAEKAAVQNWKFRFQFKIASCGGSSITSYISYDKSIFRSAWFDTDFALLELDKSPIQLGHSQIAYLGWDRSGSNPTSGAGIHHPRGNVMKISFDNHIINTRNTTLYIDENRTYPANTHWAVGFDNGTVQKCSSGSPLFDQNNRVVGQLHSVSDTALCPPVLAHYGQFHRSWTGGGTNDTRLSNWLNPDNSNKTFTNHLKIIPQQIAFQTVPMSQIITISPLSSTPVLGYNWEWAFPYSSDEARIIYSCPSYAQVVFYKPFFATGMEYRLLAKQIYGAQGTVSPYTTFTYYFQVVPSIKSIVSASAYPNPVSDILNIKIYAESESLGMQNSSTNKSSVKEYLIKLYDGSGNMLQSESTKTETLQLNVSKYPAGYYYLHIYDNINKESKPQQLIIMKQ